MTKWAESSGNLGQILSKNEGDRSEGRVGYTEERNTDQLKRLNGLNLVVILAKY